MKSGNNIMKKLLILIILILLPLVVFAFDFNVQWNAITEPDIAGYRIYKAAIISVDRSGPFALLAEVEMTTTQYTDIVQTNESWVYHITAFDTANLESSISNVVWYWDKHRPAAPNLTVIP